MEMRMIVMMWNVEIRVKMDMLKELVPAGIPLPPLPPSPHPIPNQSKPIV